MHRKNIGRGKIFVNLAYDAHLCSSNFHCQYLMLTVFYLIHLILKYKMMAGRRTFS